MRRIISEFDNLWGSYQLSGKVEPEANGEASSESAGEPETFEAEDNAIQEISTEADERFALWGKIRKAFTIAEIEEVQRTMGLVEGASNPPPTLDGCQAVYDALAEFTRKDFE